MSYLHCPRCRLAIDTRGREPILQYCPRCAARARTRSELVVSASPTLGGAPRGTAATAGAPTQATMAVQAAGKEA